MKYKIDYEHIELLATTLNTKLTIIKNLKNL